MRPLDELIEPAGMMVIGRDDVPLYRHLDTRRGIVLDMDLAGIDRGKINVALAGWERNELMSWWEE